MSTVLVYRPTAQGTDPFGDPVDADGFVVRPQSPSTYLGTLTGVVFGQAASVQSLSRGVDTNTSSGGPDARGDFSLTDSLVGFPADGPFLVQHNDLLVDTDQGVTVQCLGPRLFDRPNSLTGRRTHGPRSTGHYWMRAQTIE